MTSRRPVFLDGTNAGLLAVIVAVPLLAMVLTAGPIRRFAQRAIESQERQSVEISRLVEKKRALTPVEPSERERVDATLASFEANVASLGEEPDTQLVHELSALIESSGARDVRVQLSPPVPDQEPRSPIVVASLAGDRSVSLVPNPARIAMRSDFDGLRAVLDRMAAPGHSIQIDSAVFVREGESIRAEFDVTYWSRESVP